MLEDYSVILTLLQASSSYIKRKVQDAICNLPLGIKKAILAERENCEVRIKDKNLSEFDKGNEYTLWEYSFDEDGVYLGSYHKNPKAGDFKLELRYSNEELDSIDIGYSAVMAEFSDILFSIRKGDDQGTFIDANYYSLNVEKIGKMKFKCSLYEEDPIQDKRLISELEIAMEKPVVNDKEK